MGVESKTIRFTKVCFDLRFRRVELSSNDPLVGMPQQGGWICRGLVFAPLRCKSLCCESHLLVRGRGGQSEIPG